MLAFRSRYPVKTINPRNPPFALHLRPPAPAARPPSIPAYLYPGLLPALVRQPQGHLSGTPRGWEAQGLHPIRPNVQQGIFTLRLPSQSSAKKRGTTGTILRPWYYYGMRTYASARVSLRKRVICSKLRTAQDIAAFFCVKLHPPTDIKGGVTFAS